MEEEEEARAAAAVASATFKPPVGPAAAGKLSHQMGPGAVVGDDLVPSATRGGPEAAEEQASVEIIGDRSKKRSEQCSGERPQEADCGEEEAVVIVTSESHDRH